METELRVGVKRGQSPFPCFCLPDRKSWRFECQLCQNRGIRQGESVTNQPVVCVHLCPRWGRGCLPQGPSSRESEFPVMGSGSLPGSVWDLEKPRPFCFGCRLFFSCCLQCMYLDAACENVLSLDSFPPVPFVGKAICAVVSINTVYGVKVFPARFAGRAPRFPGKSPTAADAARAQVSGAL